MTDSAGLAEPRMGCKSCCCLCVPWAIAVFPGDGSLEPWRQPGKQKLGTQSCVEGAHRKKSGPGVASAHSCSEGTEKPIL